MPEAGKQRSVLVVDDDPDVRQVLASLLEFMGIEEIVLAVDGEDALDQMHRHAFDLVISDWMMPLMSGLELLERMRKEKIFRKIPFILVTSEAQAENVEKATEAGVDDYIVKPFAAQAIMERVLFHLS